jgi:hypothetical protein
VVAIWHSDDAGCSPLRLAGVSLDPVTKHVMISFVTNSVSVAAGRRTIVNGSNFYFLCQAYIIEAQIEQRADDRLFRFVDQGHTMLHSENSVHLQHFSLDIQRPLLIHCEHCCIVILQPSCSGSLQVQQSHHGSYQGTCCLHCWITCVFLWRPWHP